MKIHVIAFGKLKTAGLRETADYYLRLISPWVKIEETELKPITVGEKSASARSHIQKKESLILGAILEKLSNRTLIYLLDETGKSLPTQKWAEQIRKWEETSIPEIAFCLGSSLGFSTEMKKKASGIFSLGAQTLSHELARVVLLEQLFRSYSVTRGHPYHNEG